MEIMKYNWIKYQSISGVMNPFRIQGSDFLYHQKKYKQTTNSEQFTIYLQINK